MPIDSLYSKFVLLLAFSTSLFILAACEEDEENIDYEPFEYRVSELEARFNETQVVLDTKTLDDEEKSEIIDPINQYLESAEIMTNAEYNDDAYGGHWKFYITTESGEELIIGDSSVKMGDEAESAGAIVFESDESDLIGFFDDETYDGFKESFDAESYVPES